MRFDTFVQHGATLALAWYLAVTAAASIGVAVWAARAAGREPASSAQWLGARLLPAFAGLLFVATVFVPSYWTFEPRQTEEEVNVVVAAIAVAAIVLLGAAMYRGVSAWWSAARRTRAWMRQARPFKTASTALPAYEIDIDAPILALAGIVQPTLLVSRGLIEILSAEELAASIEHEIGHARAWDNLKRLAMRSMPDLLMLAPAARTIEQRWAAAAEHVADHAAGRAGPVARCALASALVKVARHMPMATPAAEPISTLIGGGDITSRVQDLLSDSAPDDRSPGGSVRLAAVLAACVVVAVAYVPLLRSVHAATEFLIHSLP